MNLGRTTTVWLLLCLLFVGWRLTFTAHIDWSWLAFHKDMAHIFWGCLITYAIMKKDDVLIRAAVAIAIFELVAAFVW